MTNYHSKTNNETSSDDGVQVFAPDKSLLAKTGLTSLDSIFTPQVIASAQQVIDESSSQFADEAFRQADDLMRMCAELKASPESGACLQSITDLAFALRTSSALSDYKLVAALAKSLFDLCKALGASVGTAVGTKEIAIIEWHVGSITQFLSQRVAGDGGEKGKAIIAELQRLQSVWAVRA